MSRVVDERVVEMRFDNQNFERNVQTSMSTIDKLKAKLNFSDVSGGFDNIEKASKGISFASLSDGIDSLSVKFSLLGYTVFKIFDDIASKISQTVLNITKNLTIAPVEEGFSKYAQKTEAVQTIMAATRNQYANQEEQMAVVNEQLEKLSWFTDETSYNFTDMVANIGKFTAAGIPLDKAVTSMQGIATWSGISGTNIQQASRVMYNLAQALGTGYVRTIDWMSVETAQMATMEFKEMLLETAAAAGTLKKQTDGSYKVITKAAKKSKKAVYATAAGMRDTLKYQWLTNDVLTATLNKYGDFTNKLYEVSSATGLTATELLNSIHSFKDGTGELAKYAEEAGISAEEFSDIIKELAADEYELGMRAFEASQEAKTFKEAINAVKDAVSSGWMDIFEQIFGNYLEAKELWTTVAEELYEVFAEPVQNLLEEFKIWNKEGGRLLMLEGVRNVWESFKNILQTVKDAFKDIFPKSASEILLDITQKFKDFSEKLLLNETTMHYLKNVFRGFFAVVSIVKDAISALWQGFKDLLSSLSDVGKSFLVSAGDIGVYLWNLRDTLRENETFKKIVSAIVDVLKGLIRIIGKIIEKIKEIGRAVAKAFENITGMTILEAFNKLKDGVIKLFDKITTFISNIKTSGISKFFNDVVQDIVNFFSSLNSFSDGEESVSGFGSAIEKASKKISPFKVLLDGVLKLLSGIWDFLKEIGPVIGKVVSTIAEWIGTLFSKIGEFFSGIGQVYDDVNSGTKNAEEAAERIEKKFSPLQTLFDALKKVVSFIWGIIQKIAPVIETVVDAVIKFVSGIVENLSALFSGNGDLKNIWELIKSGALLIAGKKLIDWITGANGPLSGFKTVIGHVQESINDFTSGINVDTLKSIATAIAILTAALIALSLMDTDKLKGALGTLAGEIALLVVAFEVIQKSGKGLGSFDGDKIAYALLGISGAVLILSGALALVGTLPEDKIETAMKALTRMAVVIVIASKMIGKNGGIALNGAIGLFLFSTAIKRLAKVIIMLSELTDEQLSRGLKGLTTILGELFVVLLLSKLYSEDFKKVASGVLRLSIAMLVFVLSVKALGSLDNAVLGKGLMSLTIILSVLAIFLSVVSSVVGQTDNGGTEMMKIAAGVLIISVALRIIAGAFKQLEGISFENMMAVLVGLGGMLIIIGAFSKLVDADKLLTASFSLLLVGAALNVIAMAFVAMSNLDFQTVLSAVFGFGVILLEIGAFTNLVDNEKLLLTGASLLVVSAALLLMSGVFLIMGQLDFNSMLVTVLGIGLVLAEIGLFTMLVDSEKLMATSVAMILVGAALNILALAIIQVGSLSIGEIAGGLVALGGMLLIIAAAFKLFNATAILQAVALLIVSAALVVLAGALQKFAMLSWAEIARALVALAGSLVILIAAMILAQGALLGAAALIVVAAALAVLAPALVMLSGITWEGIAKGLVALAGTFGVLLVAGLLLAPVTPILVAIAAAIVALGAGVLACGAGMGLFITGLKQISPSVKGAGDAVKQTIDGMKDGADSLVDKAGEVLDKIVTKVKDKAKDFYDKGKDFMIKLKDGISDKAKEATNKGKEVVDDILSFFKEKIAAFKTSGEGLVNGLKSGLNSQSSSAKASAGGIAQSITGEFSDKVSSFKTIGQNMMSGLKNGISNFKNKVVEAAKNVASKALEGAKKFLGINSPSKAFAEIGQYSDEGFAYGVSKYAYRVSDAVENLSDDSIDTMKDSFSKLASIVNNEIDADPTIRPVLDLSNISSGLSAMDSMFGDTKTIGLANRNYHDMLAKDREIQNGFQSNDDVVDAIEELRSDFASLSQVMSNLRVVMDTGSVVGAIVGPMDEALGRRMIMEGRGI